MKKLILSLFAVTFLFLISTKQSVAKVLYDKNETIIVYGEEVVNDDLFIGGRIIEINGTVNGDVFVGGETVRINGVINGDLHVGAGMVYLSGEVSDDVYIGAGNVLVTNAQIGGSLIVGTGSLDTDVNTNVGGSMLVGGGSVTNKASVGRNLFAGSGSLYIDSEVGGEVRTGSGDLTVGPNTKIGGDFYYMTDEKGNVNVSNTASISGMTTKVTPPQNYQMNMERRSDQIRSAFRGANLGLRIISFLGAFVVGFLALKVNKSFVENIASKLSSEFWKSMGVGFLTTFIALPALILLAITGVGLPLAGVLFLGLILTLYFAKIFVGLTLGKIIIKNFNWDKKGIYSIFFLGLASVYVLKMIPVIGFFATLAVIWSGVGAVVLSFKNKV